MAGSANKLPILSRRLSNGIPVGWLTSPGPISGSAVQLNLSSLDGLFSRHEPSDGKLKANDIDVSVYEPLKGESAHLGLIPFILEKFSFKKTARLDEKELNGRLESLIGSATTKSQRHSLLWSCSVPEEQVNESVKLLSELARGPGEFSDENVEEIYTMLKYESWEMRQELNFEDLLKDLIHRAAFSPNKTILASTSPTLLLSRVTEDELDKEEICKMIKRATECIRRYWTDTVEAAPGDHFSIVGGGSNESSEGSFLKTVEDSFNWLSSGLNGSMTSQTGSSSAYVGGMLNWKSDEHPLCNVSIALQCPASNDLNSHVPLAILQMLLGGGGSFSAGGPGKGMYSRLYTQMLNRYAWLEHARVFSLDYQSPRVGGLFGINASCLPDKAPQMIRLMLMYLSTQLTASLTSTELSRAKNQLKSAVLMGLESRHLMLESCAQQLASNSFLPAKDLCNRIDSVSEIELVTVANQLSNNSSLSVAAYGQTQSVPSYSEITHLFNSSSIKRK